MTVALISSSNEYNHWTAPAFSPHLLANSGTLCIEDAAAVGPALCAQLVSTVAHAVPAASSCPAKKSRLASGAPIGGKSQAQDEEPVAAAGVVASHGAVGGTSQGQDVEPVAGARYCRPEVAGTADVVGAAAAGGGSAHGDASAGAPMFIAGPVAVEEAAMLLAVAHAALSTEASTAQDPNGCSSDPSLGISIRVVEGLLLKLPHGATPVRPLKWPSSVIPITAGTAHGAASAI